MPYGALVYVIGANGAGKSTRAKAVLGLALVTGPAGCFVVWRRLAHFGETIAHSSLLGVAFAIVISIDLG